jgi:flavin reductase (DIM6/NTAB) family NADH-FMN oxidoreductase RutF
VLADALAAFDCQLERLVDRTTHRVLIGRVVGNVLGDARVMPLVGCDGRFATTTAVPAAWV